MAHHGQAHVCTAERLVLALRVGCFDQKFQDLDKPRFQPFAKGKALRAIKNRDGGYAPIPPKGKKRKVKS